MTAKPATTAGAVPIRLKDISVSSENVRKSVPDDERLDDLAASIAALGLLQPVVLMPGGPPHKLIVGQRRFLAHKKLKKTHILARFSDTTDPIKNRIYSLAENMHRSELNHADAARAVTDLYRHYKRKHGEDADRKVAKETGLSLKRVRQYILIEELATKKMKAKLRARDVEPADVKRAIKAAQGNKKKAEDLLEMMVQYEFTAHDKKRLVEYGEANPKAAAKAIVEEARKPRIEEYMMVSLADPVRAALQRATEQLNMNPEEIAAQALSEWLTAKGFADETA